MKLLTLELRDFRQFRGTQTIHFAGGEPLNVTVIFGANGTGKTTLLNSFTWALYGEFTPDFEHPERPINQRVWDAAGDGEEVSAEVQLEFEHDDGRYMVKRIARCRKEGTEPQEVRGSQVSLYLTDASGRFRELPGAADAVDQILPKRLHQFFFFNGERIDRLAQQTAYEEIEAATKTLLGLEVMERAVKHLPKVAQNFEAQLKKVGSSEQQEVAARLDDLRSNHEALEDQRTQAKRNIAALDSERDVLDGRLRDLADARALQEDRDRYEAELGQTRKRIADQRAAIDGLVSDKGFYALLGSLGEQVQSTFGELKSRGELPTPIKRTFVAELLEKGECICGTPLVEGEHAHHLVAEYMERGGVAEVEQRWIQLNSEAQNLDRDREDLRGELERAIGLLADLRAQETDLDERLSAIASKLQNLPSEEIRELEKARGKLEEKRSDWLRRDGGFEQEQDRLQSEIDAAKAELDKAQARSQEAALAQRRAAVASEAQTVFQRIYDVLQHEVRKELDGRVKETFRSISFKPREPELNEDFELRLWDVENGIRTPAAKSTGENQILSLSFVGGLASLARDQAKAQDNGKGGLEALLSGVGGIYPIVMDAAFGNLDLDYREDVARALPRLAPQSIILVSKGQASGEVMRELDPRIGRAYVITYSTPKEGEDEQISFNGHSYPYKRSGTVENEMAELTEMEVG